MGGLQVGIARRTYAAGKELGDATYQQLWTEGEAFDPDAALAYSLEVLPAGD